MPGASPEDSFACLLLAGGRSARMGVDKARLMWRGHELWEFQLFKLKQLGANKVVISARKEQGLHDQAAGSERGHMWLFDPPGEDAGPMEAIHRALTLLQMPLFVLAVDMPLMTVDFIQAHFLPRIGKGKGYVVQSNQGMQPLAAVYVPQMLPLISACIQAGRAGLQSMFRSAVEQGVADVELLSSSHERYFENLNTPDAWEKVKAGL